MRNLIHKIDEKREEIYAWLEHHEVTNELPLYSSVDIRDGGFKVASVDMNLFPAGFNNLCEHGLEDAVSAIRDAVYSRMPECKNILILAEEHTRNKWYLENVRILQQIIDVAGFCVRVATIFDVRPKVFNEDIRYVELDTATGKSLKVYSLDYLIKEMRTDSCYPDLIIMNNDLSSGIPDILHEAQIPIYPSIQAGWHARKKSAHFRILSELVKDFSDILACDPWLLTCLDCSVGPVDIYQQEDRERLMDMASHLFVKIREKYKEHRIQEKPYILLKSDSGTYGMGVHPIEDPKQILEFNRKIKNKLYKGKGSKIISHYLLQEGVPTIHLIEEQVAEICIYQISNRFIGGFYRLNSEKSNRDNLNSKGMNFLKMCPHSSKYGTCGVQPDQNIFDLYRILARMAGIAAHREIVQLESLVGV